MPFTNGRWLAEQSTGREGPAPFTALGGARPDIDVTEYIHALGGDAADYLTPGFVRPKRPTPAMDKSALTERRGTDYDLSRPLLYGSGPAEASTCRGLQATPTAIWDVNGYYRMLGFGWPFTPTRKELLAAFKAYGNHPTSEITFAFKQLWHPVIRAEYDRSPLGEPFYDEMVSEALKREAKLEAGRRSAREGREVKAEEVLDDWGMKVDEEPEPTPKKKEAPGPSQARPETVPWLWSYYLWRSNEADKENLALWQELLVEQFAILGIATTFSVGYFGKQAHRWVAVKVGQRTAILLNEGQEPTTEMAKQAVEFVQHDLLDQ